MTDLSAALVPALKSMAGLPPSGRLVKTVNLDADDNDVAAVSADELVPALTTDDQNDAARVHFQLLVSRWDGAGAEDWTAGTVANSAERRTLIYDLLGFDEDVRGEVDRAFPRAPGDVVIEAADGDWQPWYDAARQSTRSFYWDAYRGILEANPGMSNDAIARLDSATTSVVRRLGDPSWTDRFQSKGLVVGYVQSGKTANFTGVLAKAIDAGYRLIIVLTGTVEILRRQTQRRLDMELIGVENILGGIDENDEKRVATTDYYTDQDWHDGKFLRHGVPIYHMDDVPSIRRLSTFDGDYKRLKQGLSALDFRAGHELADRSRPLYDPANLFGSDVRIAVVKKNSSVLKKLVDDLGDIHASLEEIPALIIDDEADQASVNTKKQKNPTAEQKERTAINRRISDLLQRLPRAQYVGYTATPFANVFVDPDDSEDVFPKDFIVSLERPVGYMGALDFHDLDTDFAGETKTAENSNEKAYVRDLYSNDSAELRRGELQRALDSFVLSGALKLYRREPTGQTFRHHTMLVHESVKKSEHAALADEIRENWKKAGYDMPAGIQRLHEIYDDDFAPTTAALRARAERGAAGGVGADDSPMPASFEELVTGGWLTRALDLIDKGTSPVIVVNGTADKDYEQDALDFQADDVWKILVGGAKLSRGFTVEGLTISYYTRRTQQADTLMQMGRWFGFRRGYRDLVRLFIGRDVPAPSGKHVDLYDAFEAVVQDEEDFRAELRRYAALRDDDGHPKVRPQDVPPMVFQQVPWLKPTAANKMYNAELVSKGEGGKLVDFSLQPDRDPAVNTEHFAAVRPLLDAMTETGTFGYVDDTTGAAKTYSARYGVLDAATVRDVVAQFHWARAWWFAPYLEFFDEIVKEGTLDSFAVLLPDLIGSVRRRVGAVPGELPILKRARRSRGGFSGSSKRQRPAIETIAGKRSLDSFAPPGAIDESGGPEAVELYTPTRAAMLLTLSLDNDNPDAKPKDLDDGVVVDPGDVATLFSWALPYDAAPNGRIGFKPRRHDAGAIIDSE